MMATELSVATETSVSSRISGDWTEQRIVCSNNLPAKLPSLKVENITERSGNVIIEADGWHISTGGYGISCDP